MEAVLDLRQDGTVLSGAIGTHMFDLEISGGSVTGDEIVFATKIEMAGREVEIPFAGKLVDGKIELTAQAPGGMPPVRVLMRRATEEEAIARAGIVPEKIAPPAIHMSLWSLLASPLLAGNDLRDMSQQTVDLLTNPEVIAINQDPLGRQARRVAQDGELEVWAKPLDGGRVAAGLFNRGEEAAAVTARWADLELDGKVQVRDAWAKKDLGSFADEFTAEVEPHGVALVVLKSR